MSSSILSPLSSGFNSQYNLFHQLTTAAPKLRPNPPKKRKSTNTKNSLWLRPAQIVEWQEFDLANLQQTCNGLFFKMLLYPVKPIDFSYLDDDVTEFTAERSFESFLFKWTHTIVSKALSKAQNQCELLHPPYVDMVVGCDAWAPQKFQPDWAGVRKAGVKHHDRPDNILPGDTKVSYKWKSTEINTTKIPSDYAPSWLWPIMQVFTYCVRLNTRYGYIITDEEIVILRVRVDRGLVGESGPHGEKSDDSTSEKEIPDNTGTVEYTSISYDCSKKAHDEGCLTMNLALWWLHLLAANNPSIQPSYPPLKEETLQKSVASPATTDYDDARSFRDGVEVDRDSLAGTVTNDGDALETRESSIIFSPQEPGHVFSFTSFAKPESSFRSNRVEKGSKSSGKARARRIQESKEPEDDVTRRKKRRKGG